MAMECLIPFAFSEVSVTFTLQAPQLPHQDRPGSTWRLAQQWAQARAREQLLERLLLHLRSLPRMPGRADHQGSDEPTPLHAAAPEQTPGDDIFSSVLCTTSTILASLLPGMMCMAWEKCLHLGVGAGMGEPERC